MGNGIRARVVLLPWLCCSIRSVVVIKIGFYMTWSNCVLTCHRKHFLRDVPGEAAEVGFLLFNSGVSSFSNEKRFCVDRSTRRSSCSTVLVRQLEVNLQLCQNNRSEEMKLKELQFKCLHRVVVTIKELLRLAKISADDEYLYCGDLDSIDHNFIHCHFTKVFMTIFRKYSTSPFYLWVTTFIRES